jgi:uncharacterized protein
LLAAIEGRPWTGAPATAPPVNTTSPYIWILGGFVFVAFLIFAITHPRMAMFLLWTIVTSGRRNGTGGGGGGFRGGGGRSGGGGARGGW